MGGGAARWPVADRAALAGANCVGLVPVSGRNPTQFVPDAGARAHPSLIDAVSVRRRLAVHNVAEHRG
jgi:hypothetical protein